MLWKEVIGQETAQKGIKSLFNSGRMPHAVMINAKEGLGGLVFALAFSNYVLCEDRNDNDACGTCASCQKVRKLAHPDLHLSFPTVSPKPGTKASSNYYLNEFREFVAQTPYGTTFDWLQYINAENKQGNITAEECREIIETLSLKAFEGKHKIQIIWRPEYLGKEGNILLKIIEEPPADTLIIMVAENTESVLKTILSRTQEIQLLPLSAKDITAALRERAKIETNKAMQIAQIANGSYTQALDLLSHTDDDLLILLKNWFNGIFTNNGLAIYNWVEECTKGGREQIKNFLQFAQQMVAHAMRLTYIENYVPKLPQEETDFCRKLATQKFTYSVYENINQELNKTIYHIERNAHAKTQLLYMSIQMQYIIKNKLLRIGDFIA